MDAMHDHPRDYVISGWIEYSVATYWTRHAIVRGDNLRDMARKWQNQHPTVTLDCIGRYTGLKLPGESLDESDIPHMQGYRDNPGRVLYFNGAKPA
jgi:hypothetical protein